MNRDRKSNKKLGNLALAVKLFRKAFHKGGFSRSGTSLKYVKGILFGIVKRVEAREKPSAEFAPAKNSGENSLIFSNFSSIKNTPEQF